MVVRHRSDRLRSSRLVALAVSPVLLAARRGVYRRQMRRAVRRELKDLESGALGVVQEVLAAVRVVKAFGREDHEQRPVRQPVARGPAGPAPAPPCPRRLLGLLVEPDDRPGDRGRALHRRRARSASGALTLGELLRGDGLPGPALRPAADDQQDGGRPPGLAGQRPAGVRPARRAARGGRPARRPAAAAGRRRGRVPRRRASAYDGAQRRAARRLVRRPGRRPRGHRRAAPGRARPRWSAC